MDGENLLPLLELLEDNIDDLEEVLEPLLETTLTSLNKSLPLLDKAKIHVLLTYTIESLLFSYLRLHGVEAIKHPVFKELTRVKQYFAKIQAAENPVEKRENLSLNKDAARRVITHALAGNDKIDLLRAEKLAKERAAAQLRARLVGVKRKIEEVNSGNTKEKSSDSEPESNDDSEAPEDENDEDIPTPMETSTPDSTNLDKAQVDARKGSSRKARRKSKNKKGENSYQQTKGDKDSQKKKKSRKKRSKKQAQAQTPT